MKTIKKRSTFAVDTRFKKKDKRAFFWMKRQLEKNDKSLRELYKDLWGLNILESTDLKDLTSIVDAYFEFKRDIISNIESRLKPEEWSEK